jgi:hypothetical protein
MYWDNPVTAGNTLPALISKLFNNLGGYGWPDRHKWVQPVNQVEIFLVFSLIHKKSPARGLK